MHKITDDAAIGASSLALSWAIMLTLIRKGLITKDELVTSLRLSFDPKHLHSAIVELITKVEGLREGVKGH